MTEANTSSWPASIEDVEGLRCLVVRITTLEAFSVFHAHALGANGLTVAISVQLTVGSRLPLWVHPPAGEDPVKIPATVLLATPHQTLLDLQMDHPRVARRWDELHEDLAVDGYSQDEGPDEALESETAAEAGTARILTPMAEGAEFSAALNPDFDEFAGAMLPSIDPLAESDEQPPTIAGIDGQEPDDLTDLFAQLETIAAEASAIQDAQDAHRKASEAAEAARPKPVARQRQPKGGFTNRMRKTSDAKAITIRKKRDVKRVPRRMARATKPDNAEAPVPPDDPDHTP